MSSIIHAIGGIFQPLLKAVADLLAILYSFIPNYPIDIVILTIIIMALLTPLTVKSTKNMAAMQALGPEMKKLQQKYKGAENRVLLNEEMMKLYKEHQVNPASGCLPMLLQMPAFLVLYDVIRGITNTVNIPGKHITTAAGLKIYKPPQIIAQPRYISPHTKMYHDIVASHGQLNAFGMDFSQKLLSHHSSLFVAVPFLLLVVASVGLQYLQMSRLNARNPNANAANPQAAMIQKYMPLIFGLIYLNVPAIINVYFITSSAIRIGTQEVLFRKGLVAGPAPAPGGSNGNKGSGARSTSVRTSSEQGRSKEKEIPRGRPPARSTGVSTQSGATRSSQRPSGNGKRANPKPELPAGSPAGDATNNGKPARPSKSGGDQSGSAGRSDGTKVSKAQSYSNGSKGGTGPATNGSRSSSNGSNSRSGRVVEADEEQSKEHPRSKAKRERKAR